MKFISFQRGRLAVAMVFVAIGVLLIMIPRFVGWQWSGSSTLVDLGSEFLGLALTVSILDWFFEQRRMRSDGRRLAWEVFHAVERAVWTWQGGPFRLETDELLGLLNGVGDDDPIAPCTEELLLGLGIRGRELLKGETRVVSSIPEFSEALSELAGLARIGEGKKPRPSTVRSALTTSAKILAGILDLSAPHLSARLIRDRSSSVEDQERRYAMGRAALAA